MIQSLNQNIKLLSKYLKLLMTFFRISFIADLEFRFNFVVLIINEFIWYASNLLIFEILYRHSNNLAGWSIEQMRVFVFLGLFVDSIYMILWNDNFSQFSEDIRKGQLDLLLTKPVNALFMLTTKKISITHIPCFFITLAGLFWASSQIIGFNYFSLLWLIICVPAGLTVIFCGRMALNTTMILFERADFLQYVWFSLFRLGMRPDGIYNSVGNGALRTVLIYILPFAMVSSIPARFLFEPLNYVYLAWTLIMPFILISLIKRYWNYCIQHYASASS